MHMSRVLRVVPIGLLSAVYPMAAYGILRPFFSHGLILILRSMLQPRPVAKRYACNLMDSSRPGGLLWNVCPGYRQTKPKGSPNYKQAIASRLCGLRCCAVQ